MGKRVIVPHCLVTPWKALTKRHRRIIVIVKKECPLMDCHAVLPELHQRHAAALVELPALMKPTRASMIQQMIAIQKMAAPIVLAFASLCVLDLQRNPSQNAQKERFVWTIRILLIVRLPRTVPVYVYHHPSAISLKVPDVGKAIHAQLIRTLIAATILTAKVNVSPFVLVSRNIRHLVVPQEHFAWTIQPHRTV